MTIGALTGYMPIVIAALSVAVLFALEDTLSKKAVAARGRVDTLLYVLLGGFIPLLAYVLLFGGGTLGYAVAVLSLMGSVFLAAGYILIYISVGSEMVTTTYTLNDLQPAFLILFGIFVFGESLGLAQAAGMLVIFAGAALLFTTERNRINMKLAPAAIANVSWSVYWFFMVFAMDYAHGFGVPLILVRLGALAIVLAYVGIRRKRRSGRNLDDIMGAGGARRGRGRAIAAGVTIGLGLLVMGLADGLGNMLMGYVFLMKYIVVGSAITALGPVFVALFGYAMYRDRLTMLQGVGFLIMVAGAVALAVL